MQHTASPTYTVEMIIGAAGDAAGDYEVFTGVPWGINITRTERGGGGGRGARRYNCQLVSYESEPRSHASIRRSSVVGDSISIHT